MQKQSLPLVKSSFDRVLFSDIFCYHLVLFYNPTSQQNFQSCQSIILLCFQIFWINTVTGDKCCLDRKIANKCCGWQFFDTFHFAYTQTRNRLRALGAGAGDTVAQSRRKRFFTLHWLSLCCQYWQISTNYREHSRKGVDWLASRVGFKILNKWVGWVPVRYVIDYGTKRLTSVAENDSFK